MVLHINVISLIFKKNHKSSLPAWFKFSDNLHATPRSWKVWALPPSQGIPNPSKGFNPTRTTHLAGDPTDILGLVIRPAKLGNRATFLPKQSTAAAIQRALPVHLCPESIHIKNKILKTLNRNNYNFRSVAFNVSSKLRQE